MKPLKSFREYVNTLKEHNEIVSINQEVDWNLEMSAIIRRAYELPSPAPLFKNIKDSIPGFEVLGAPVGMSPNKEHPFIRVALSLGLPINTSGPKLVEAWSNLHDVKPIPPRLVETGECKENKVFGDEIDLTKLPVPFIHVGDGGRYINTYGILIVRTPDGSWINWSISRVMLDGPRSMAGVVIASQDIGKIYEEWNKIGKEMPFALCLGVDPGIAMIAGYPLPDNVNEGEMIGGWYGEAIDVVKCETSDLEVPATSEIVIEGTASLKDKVPEGPMGEYAGYTWVGHGKSVPLFHVNAMTHRNNPIMPVTAAGIPPEENHTNWGVAIAASIQNALKHKGLPIKECFIPLESAVHWLVVTVDSNYKRDDDAKLAYEIGKTVFESKAGSYVPKVIVLDDDIDTSDLNRVVWAFATRHHPDNRIIIPNQKVLPLVAYLDKKEKSEARTNKVVYNCLSPSKHLDKDKQPIEASFGSYSEELRNKIINNWEKYGF
ncbi:UbiD family decarboxylase [Clostridium aciditolerans]|uniref:Pyrrole-2-carboxylic acid decarboxylase n=1 Tax=Clostridium aciditolerans TaxID=339861 RepID=A0A934HPZ9_9CLOT|nr:UbiD family decarboxylase [Clostridium aciditolerans]MBI6871128.1 UbiD family decarboxylase [Clostridium aciditolerans]